MYIDFIKNDYSNISKEKRDGYINRDKKELQNIIRERIDKDLPNIVDRWYKHFGM